ncbi:unnamed protein product [Hydatigera taeniaeformis]|uniref:Similar to n=1 Tax=Hydatigena taeniaeformis TaxID=6205 RepID=A0A0R3WMT1_HYDTA|nr:unnamed protein product [Hydatigera taeniaeformis]
MYGESTELNPNVEELVTHSDDALSHCNPFRSPFDPRSEEDLISSTYERNGGLTSSSTTHRYRHRSEWPKHEETNGLNAYDTGPLPAPRRSMRQGSWADGELPRLAPVMKALKEEMEEGDDYDDDDDSWVDDESGLRPPALPVNLEAALAELPAEDPAMRTKRLRPLQYPLYVNTTSDQNVVGADIYDRIKFHEGVGPLRTMDQNIPEEELPDTLLIRTRRRTMSGVTGFLPRSSTLSSSSIWFGDHAVPTKTQIYAAEQSPLRLSSIQLQAQAEIARRRSRNNLAARSIISIGDGRSDGTRRSRSLERSRTLGPSSALYGPTGRRVHGGAPIVERAIKRHASKRDGYETLSLVHVPRVDEVPSSITSVTAAEQHKLRRRASSTSVARYGTSAGAYQLNCTRSKP